MKFFRLDLLTLLISLFILNSCKNPEGVGLDVEDQLSGTLIADTTVTLNTEREDSVAVGNLGRTPLALFRDPEIGTTTSSIAAVISLPNAAAYTIPTGDIKIDSVVLGLKYSPTGFYGDSVSARYKVNIYQLSEKASASAAYYSSKTWAYDATKLLGTKTFAARPHDTLSIHPPDSAEKFIDALPQVRVKLDTAFIRTHLFTAGNQIKSNDNFQTAVKGLYIKLDEEGTTLTGGVLPLSTPDSIFVYYTLTNDSKTVRTLVSLPINRHIAETKHDYSADVLSAIADKTTSNTKAYLKGMGGLRVKVTFPGLQALKDMQKDIIINRAELVVTPYPNSTIPYAPLPYLTMYKFDLAKQRTYIEDMVGSYAVLFGGRLGLPVKNEYRFLLTTYIQNLVLGKTEDYGTYIGAANESGTTGTDIGATAYPTARTIL
ncbi:MAG: DUF4270 family protein, partial [Sphingobacteriales bacterium]